MQAFQEELWQSAQTQPVRAHELLAVRAKILDAHFVEVTFLR